MNKVSNMIGSEQLLVLLCCVAFTVSDGTNSDEAAARQFLEHYNNDSIYHFSHYSEWIWEEHLTMEDFLEAEEFRNDMRNEALKFNESAMTEDTRRKLSKIKNIGIAAQPNLEKVKELADVKVAMANKYVGGTYCEDSDCDDINEETMSHLEPSQFFIKSSQVWAFWRKETASGMRPVYSKFVQLSNEAVQLAGYHDLGEQLRSEYESDTLLEELKGLYEKVLPLYHQLHAYVRKHFKDVYGNRTLPSTGHIPANLLGILTDADWGDLYENVVPYKNKAPLNITEALINNNYDALKMVKTAEDFITSMGFPPMAPTFWNKSRLEESEESCTNYVLDFHDGEDFRLHACPDLTESSFTDLHLQMARLAYMMQYKDLPYVYRQPPHPAFLDAVADMIGLSIQSPKYMKKLGFIDKTPTDKEVELNVMMNTALRTVALLPLAYVQDLWRWSVFDGSTPEDDYNTKWWELRCNMQGVSPPVKRSRSDFDAFSHPRIAFDLPAIQNFLSIVLQFQFHRAVCKETRSSRIPHRCDIFESTAAGRKLQKMMKLGASKHWRIALEQLTGSKNLDIQPLLDYFKPLKEFLEKENGNNIGWTQSC